MAADSSNVCTPTAAPYTERTRQYLSSHLGGVWSRRLRREAVDGGGVGGGGRGESSESDFEHTVSLAWCLDMHRYTIKCLPEEEIITRKLFT